MTQEIILAPENLPVLSKENAASFHSKAKEIIYEQGGVFQYIELIKFFAALDKQISGDTASKIEPDKEFLDYIRTEIERNGEKGKYVSARGVKFEVAEVGTKYDFSQCNDTELAALEGAAKLTAEAIKERQAFLKTLPLKGMEILEKNTGELVTIYPPSKTSKSSFKVQLPK